MIRVLLAVVVASALLAVSLPAIEDARADRTASEQDRAAERLVRAGRSLLASDAAGAGARRVVTLHVPAGSLTRAGVARVAVVCDATCALSYRLDGGRIRARDLGALPLATPDGPVAVSLPGEHRVVLRLARIDGRRVVTVHG